MNGKRKNHVTRQCLSLNWAPSSTKWIHSRQQRSDRKSDKDFLLHSRNDDEAVVKTVLLTDRFRKLTGKIEAVFVGSDTVKVVILLLKYFYQDTGVAVGYFYRDAEVAVV